ncbi:MAG: DUF547 domain-containing protein, partial [Rhodothermales bacterium]|nr:DUF547 domain-containing protein [Rhodothermales bacterium]
YLLEHWILRRRFDDARIHFAINCASASCPVLAPEAYRASDLEQQLDAAARGFVQDEFRNQLNPSGTTARLSSLFRWFRREFGGTDDAVRAYVARHASHASADWLLQARPSLEYLEYDWSLNDLHGQPDGAGP